MLNMKHLTRSFFNFKACVLAFLTLIFSSTLLYADLVTIRVVGSVQANDEIAASRVWFRPTDESVGWTAVYTGEQADLTPSVEYFFDIVPGMPDGNNYPSLLQRRVILSYGGESSLTFEWKRTLVNFSLVNQDGAGISNSVIKITVGSVGTTMIAFSNQESALLPVTHGEYVDVSGEFSNSGYTINVIPGRNGEQGLESLLYRTETLQLYSSSEAVDAAYVWKEITCPLQVIESPATLVSHFSLEIGSGLGSSTAINGDVIRLPSTDEIEYLSMDGAYLSGFPVTLSVEGSLVGSNIFEVTTGATFGAGLTITDGVKSYTTNCTAVDDEPCIGNAVTDDFESGLDGSVWASNTGSNWTVMNESGNNVLKQDGSAPGYGVEMLRRTDVTSGSEFEMEVKIKLIKMMGVDQGAGLFFNYTSVSGVESYYTVYIYRDADENKTHHSITKYEDCDGDGIKEFSSKAGGPFTGRPFDDYAKIKIKKEGGGVRVFINDVEWGYNYYDGDYINGSVGLLTTGDALFDDFYFNDCGRDPIQTGISCNVNWSQATPLGRWMTVDNTTPGEPDPFLEQTNLFDDWQCVTGTTPTVSRQVRLENGEPIQTLSAFTMETNVQLVKWYVYYYSAAGVFFNDDGNGNFYAVWITASGTYVVKFINGVFTYLSPGYSVKPTTPGDFNKLKVVKVGGHIRVYFDENVEPSIEAYDGEYINGTGGIISYYGPARFDCEFSFTNHNTSPILAQAGLDPSWTPMEGNWLTVDNKDDLGNNWIEQAGDVNVARLKRNGIEACTPFSIETKLQFLGYPNWHSNTTGIIFNDDGNGNFYEAVLHFTGSLYINKYSNDSYVLNFGYAFIGQMEALRFYHLKIEKNTENKISVFVDDVNVLSNLQDPNTPYADGTVGLITRGKYARFDDFAFSSPCTAGSLSGFVSANCPAMNTALSGVRVDLFSEGSGELIKSVLTDQNGQYVADSLTVGTYVVTIVTPLGYSATAEEVAVTITGGENVTVDFPLTCLTIVSTPRTIGFWKHQVGVATGGKGTAQVDAATLCYYLDLIEIHFNNNLMNQVVMYQTPSSDATCQQKLQVAKALLNLQGSQTMEARARQQLMALLLNVVSGNIGLLQSISSDGAVVSQAITHSDNLIDNPNGNRELAKTICDLINNGQQVPPGAIPLSTPIIAYKIGSDQKTMDVPKEFALYQNYPNPFNPTTTIRFDMPEEAIVTLKIFDMLGREVATLIPPQRYNAGVHNITLSLGNTPTGLYTYQIAFQTQHKSFSDTKKLLLVK